MKNTFGSLFSGIGGMDLGLERAGMTCKWQVEIDDYATKVLARHWPSVRRYRDVCEFEPTSKDRVDLIAGGFPCQDISSAGKRVGIDGSRSGLWYEFARIIRTLRPRYVIVENVAALLIRGLDRVLGDLAESGYDAEWQLFSAAEFGAPHIRFRVFILAYAAGFAVEGPILQRSAGEFQCGEFRGNGFAGPTGTYWETGEPPLFALDDGVSCWAPAVKAIGNAVVPQVAEWIGNQIMRGNGTPKK